MIRRIDVDAMLNSLKIEIKNEMKKTKKKNVYSHIMIHLFIAKIRFLKL